MAQTAPTLNATGQEAIGTTLTSYLSSFTIPSGTTVGDMMVLAFVSYAVPTGPSGWTQQAQSASGSEGGYVTVYTKRAVSGDPGSSITFDAAAAVQFASFTNCGADPIVVGTFDTSTSYQYSGTYTVTAPSLTTVDANCAVCDVFGVYTTTPQSGASSSPAITLPSTEVEAGVVGHSTDTSDNGVYWALGISYQDQAAAGASSAQTATVTLPVSDYWTYGGIQIALPPIQPPSAPTLTAPANASYDDLAGTPTFTWTYNPTTGDGAQSAIAFRRKVSGAGSYSYWNAGTSAFQSTEVWNPYTTGSLTFTSGSWSNSSIYNWSVATEEATESQQGVFAPDFTVTGQGPGAVSITAPTGTITTTAPTVTATATVPSGSSLVSYRIIIYTYAQTQESGFTPGTTAGIYDSGTVGQTSLSISQATSGLSNNITYVPYALVTATGSDSSVWTAGTAFTVSFDPPADPTVTVTASTDGTTGCPVLAIAVQGHDNLLSALDASFEGSLGTWAPYDGGVLYVTSSYALDSSDSMALAQTVTGSDAATGDYSVVGGSSYVTMGAFRAVSQPRTISMASYEGVDGAQVTDSPDYWTWSIGVGTEPSAATADRLIAEPLGATPELATPAAPTVTPEGTAGTTSYFYKLVGHNVYGTVTGAEGSTTTGNATLSSTNYNALAVVDPVNRADNGLLLDGTTGWSAYACCGSGAVSPTISVDTGSGLPPGVPGNALKIVGPAAGSNTNTYTGAAASGQGVVVGTEYTVACWVKADSVASGDGFNVYTPDSINGSSLTLSEEYQFYTFTWTPTAAGSGGGFVRWTGSPGGDGTVWVAGYEIVAGASAVPTGSLISSWDVWRGTAAGAEDVLVASGLTGTSYNDTGGGTSGSIPTTNTTGETHLVDCAGIFPGDTLGYQLEVLSDGPSAYFPLTDGPGSTTVYNAVGSGVGTVNGGVTFGEPGVVASDASQTAALFDGASGYVQTSESPAARVSVTVEAWYRTSQGAGTQVIWDSGAANNGTGVGLWIAHGGLTGVAVSGNSLNDPTSSDDGLWHHAAFSVTSGGTAYLFRDGVQVASLAVGATTAALYPGRIGSYGGALADLFNGDIAHVAVYPTALSPTRIAAHYNAALNTAGSIVQKWTRGGLAGITTVTLTRSDGLIVRSAYGASMPTPSQTFTVSDYEVVSGTDYTYSAVISANLGGSAVITSAAATSTSVSLTNTKWWVLDPTNTPSACSPQATQWNPVQIQQTTAHLVLGQNVTNIVGSVTMNPDFNATFELFDNATYNAFEKLLSLGKPVFISNSATPGDSGYYLVGPVSGGLSMGMGVKAKDSQLLPSTSAAPHRTVQITAVAAPRPTVVSG